MSTLLLESKIYCKVKLPLYRRCERTSARADYRDERVGYAYALGARYYVLAACDSSATHTHTYTHTHTRS